MTAPSSLTALPKVVVEAILEHADVKDLGRIDCVARVFHGGMIETVLRRLAQRATGRAVPLGDPPRNVVAPRTWTQRLLREMLRWWWKLPGGAPKVETVTGILRMDFSVTDAGAVYSQGEGRWGRLGHGNDEDQDVPKLIEALSGVRVCAVSAGGWHSLFLTEDGKAYSCGHGGLGQLGHGNQEHQDVPKLIEALSGVRVCAVSAGHRHSLFLTEDGKAYSCGHGQSGRLGHGNQERQLVPKLIEALSGVRVCAVSAGGDHSLFLTEDGKTYSCGYGRYGMLGHGNEEHQLVPKRIETFHPAGPRIYAICAQTAAESKFATDCGESWQTGFDGDDVITTPHRRSFGRLVVVRTVLVLLTAGFAAGVPQFQLVTNLVGGVCNVCVAFILPPLIHLSLSHRRTAASPEGPSALTIVVDVGIAVIGFCIVCLATFATIYSALNTKPQQQKSKC
eukprot:g2200.t1